MTSKPAQAALRLEPRGPRHTGEGSLPDWYEDLTLAAQLLDRSEIVLFKGNWELAPILEWLEESESAIREQIPPITQLVGETIGQTLARAYNVVSDDLPIDVIDLASEALYQYNRRHNVAIGAPGMDGVPRLLLGRGINGHEICNWISDVDTDAAWRYLFDVDDFFAHLPSE
ncbi:hypothetical protein [Gordonia sp. (in: high G+C Gram-positive bacteria)]|uniref:hypothetical protein n=1 Tax=Gordonia sp. (in: high G+C Gram-positive bacteria) TaxID=84139 RepID=UPI002580EE95|nr:hypothetical protein [Gordonia sp. (in: high G+C Gram-positive bacteria)]